MKNWKNILLIVLAMGMAFSLKAQEEPSWKQTLPRHDIQFGIGDPALLFLNNTDICIGCDYYPLQQNADSWFEDYVNTLTFAAPTINLEYRYPIGAATVEVAVLDKRLTTTLHTDDATRAVAALSMPNSKIMDFAILAIDEIDAVGVTGIDLDARIPLTLDDQALHVEQCQLTAVGVQVGKKWYGFTEVGFGAQGFVKAGFGYKFQDKEKKSE